MSFSSVAVPPPHPDDHEDVAWALQAAKAQWAPESWRDAIRWLERAAQTAEELGAFRRSVEILQLVASLSRAAEEAESSATPTTLPVLPIRSSMPASRSSGLPSFARGPLPSAPEIEAELEEEDIPDLELDEASIDFEDLEEDEEVELEMADATEIVEYDSRVVNEISTVEATAEDELPSFDSDDRETNRLPPPPMASDTIRTPDAEDPDDAVQTSASFESSEERQTNPDLAMGSWVDPLAPAPFGGEVDFEDEAPTFVREHGSRPPPPMPGSPAGSSGPPPESLGPPDPVPVDMGAAIDRREPAVFAAAQDPGPPSDDQNDIERELGIDLSLRFAYPQTSSSAPQSATGKRIGHITIEPAAEPEPVPSAPPAATRSSAPPFEPFPTAPSATLPPTRPIEPPSRPFHAPPPDSMREPDLHFEEYDYPNEAEGPAGAVNSAPPARAIEMPPPTSRRSARPSSEPADSLFPVGLTDTTIDGVHLLEVPGLGEFSKDALTLLLSSARKVKLSPGEEVNSFAAALVTRGTVQLMPTIADASCATVRKGGVIFTQGSIEAGIDLRVVGFDLGTRVVVFDREPFKAALEMCPWVVEELAAAADNYQALAGAVMGPLGESFDEMFRSMVLDKLAVKHVRSGETVARAGKPIDGVYVVGAGTLIVESATGAVTAELGPGDFVFPETLLSGSPASGTVRATDNALVLFAGRMVAHELFATCPPFIELLASA